MTRPSGLRRFVTGLPAAPPLSPAAPHPRSDGPPGRPRSDGPRSGGPPDGPSAASTKPDGPMPRGVVPDEKCEFCAAEIGADHSHVADIDRSSLMCACRACYLLFTHAQAGLARPTGVRGRYRAVPDRYLTDPDHPVSDSEWDRLEIPVGLAFFLRRSAQDTVSGFYPSPAGATECRLDLRVWEELTQAHPVISAAQPDVEAVLITRDAAVIDCFVVPIDACYELAGLMRLHWRGFDGGSEARAHLTHFLDDVRTRASTLAKGR